MIIPELILLAGGRSARMGRSKALLVLDGRPWIEAQLARFAEGGGASARVVVAPRVAEELAWVERAMEGPTDVLGLSVRAFLSSPSATPFDSLRRAIDPASAAFVSPIDVPLSIAALAVLAGALEEHDAALPVYGGRRGHPVLLSARFCLRVGSMDAPDARLDRALAEATRREVPVDDPAVLLNLNTPDEWNAWVASSRRCYAPPP